MPQKNGQPENHFALNQISTNNSTNLRASQDTELIRKKNYDGYSSNNQNNNIRATKPLKEKARDFNLKYANNHKNLYANENYNEEEILQEEIPEESQHENISNLDNNYSQEKNKQDTVESVSKVSDISLHFLCDVHKDEEYNYYSAHSKKLLCAQCLLESTSSGKIRTEDVRPIKKSLSLILQHFEDFLNDVEVNRNLVKNKNGEIQIKGESLKIKVNSFKNRYDIKFDELIEALTDQKNKAMQMFENSFSKFFDNIDVVSQNLNERVSYLEEMLEQISMIQDSSQSPNEDLLQYYFSNQIEFESILKNKSLTKEVDKVIFLSEKFTNKIDIDLVKGIEKNSAKFLNQSEKLLFNPNKFEALFSNNDTLSTDDQESYRLIDVNKKNSIHSDELINFSNKKSTQSRSQQPAKESSYPLYNNSKQSVLEPNEDYKVYNNGNRNDLDRVNNLKDRILALGNNKAPTRRKTSVNLNDARVKSQGSKIDFNESSVNEFAQTMPNYNSIDLQTKPKKVGNFFEDTNKHESVYSNYKNYENQDVSSMNCNPYNNFNYNNVSNANFSTFNANIFNNQMYPPNINYPLHSLRPVNSNLYKNNLNLLKTGYNFEKECYNHNISNNHGSLSGKVRNVQSKYRTGENFDKL